MPAALVSTLVPPNGSTIQRRTAIWSASRSPTCPPCCGTKSPEQLRAGGLRAKQNPSRQCARAFPTASVVPGAPHDNDLAVSSHCLGVLEVEQPGFPSQRQR